MLLALAAIPAEAHAQPAPLAREARLAEAREQGHDGDYLAARATLLALLAAEPGDDEARAALARVDAWSGRYDEAIAGFLSVLCRHPHDTEVLAGLVDAYLWSGQWILARLYLQRGLRQAPRSSALWERRARLALWEGDVAAARQLADRALELEGPSLSLVRLREQLWLGELRFRLAWSFFPSNFPDLPFAELLARQRIGAFTVGARVEQARRFSTIEGLAELNGFYAASVAYRLADIASVSAEVGFGAPARAVARFALQAGGAVEIGDRVTAELGYGYRYFDGDRQLHLVHPTLTVAVTRDVRLAADYWLTVVAVAPEDDDATSGTLLDVLHTGGPRVAWRLRADVDVGAWYAYGSQTELIPALFQLTRVDSHQAGVWADWLISAKGGLRPAYDLEIRKNQGGLVTPIHTPGITAYGRW